METMCAKVSCGRWAVMPTFRMTFPSRHCLSNFLETIHTARTEPSSYLLFSEHRERELTLCIQILSHSLWGFENHGWQTVGWRDHLFSLRKGLEAGLPPPRTDGFTASLCKGNIEPWPWALLWGLWEKRLFHVSPKRWKMRQSFGTVMHNKCGHLTILLSCQNI